MSSNADPAPRPGDDATRNGSDAPARGDLDLVRRLLGQARPYRWRIAGLFLVDLLATPLALLVPVPLALAVDHVLGDAPLPEPWAAFVPDAFVGSTSALLAFTAGLVIAVALLTQLQALARTLLSTFLGERLVLRFRNRLFHHLQRLSLSYHDRTGTSDSLYRVQYDAVAIQTVVVNGLAPLVTTFVTVVAMLAIMAGIELRLALVALVVTPVLWVLTRVYRSRLRRQWNEVKRLESGAMSIVHEVLGAQRVVKAFRREEHEQRRFANRSHASIGAKLRAVASEGAFNLMIGLTTALGTAAVLYIGTRSIQAGSMTVGGLVLVMSYLAQLYRPLESIGKRVAQLQNAFASANRAYELLDRAPEVTEKPDARPLKRARGGFAFHEVAFAYPGGSEVVSDVSFSVAPGTRVGIIGPTGAGKSTLMSLVCRFYDPTGGRIVLDGVDLRDYALDDLRRQYAVVLQEPLLFSATVAENIAYGRPDAARAEVRAAARAAGADDFIVRLGDGYDTEVGERGLGLSGGERQRIALARAFLRDAPILIMDEPTSSVDVKTEAGIVDAMRRLMRNRTTFTVAHRLSTLDDCDLLLTVEGGRLVGATRHVREAIAGAARQRFEVKSA